VGTSKDIEDTVVSEMQREAESAQAAAGRPVDLTDPIWHPIDGITLDKYAQLTAAMARHDLGTPEETEAWLDDQGVEPGTWAVVQTGWVNRMATSEAVRTRYGILYSQS
jgi:kynurenine formamidase